MIYKDKLKTANNLDEIIIASTNYVNEDLKHTRKDSFKEFARGDVLIRVGSNDYSAKVIVGFTKGNEMVLYDIINFTPKKFDIRKVGMQYRTVAYTATHSRLNTPTIDSISQSENNVNTKNNTDKGVGSGDVKYSIKENVKNKVSGEIYDKVVVLDTNIFKGIPPRNWGKTFRNFISKHLIGKKFLTFDENGKEEIIEFAKPNERVTKNGANNSHKVLDKLSRKSDRNSKLVIVHSDEVINISEKQNENAEHSHQWLDENGWEFRNAFVMDKYGKIYSVTLNIAKSKDGRNILYDINKINEVGYGDVLSNAKGKRSSHINPNFVTNSISQNSKNVNTKNTVLDIPQIIIRL